MYRDVKIRTVVQIGIELPGRLESCITDINVGAVGGFDAVNFANGNSYFCIGNIDVFTESHGTVIDTKREICKLKNFERQDIRVPYFERPRAAYRQRLGNVSVEADLSGFRLVCRLINVVAS